MSEIIIIIIIIIIIKYIYIAQIRRKKTPCDSAHTIFHVRRGHLRTQKVSKLLAAGALPQTPLRVLTALPQIPYSWASSLGPSGGGTGGRVPPGAGGEGAPPPRQEREHFGEGDFVIVL